MQDQDVGGTHGQNGGDLRLGRAFNLVAEQASLGVQALQAQRNGARSVDIVGQQQLDAHGGIVQAAGGVEARRQYKADVAFIQPRRAEGCRFSQGGQAWSQGGAHLAQAALKPIARVAGLEGDVGDDAERDQINQTIGTSAGSASMDRASAQGMS